MPHDLAIFQSTRPRGARRLHFVCKQFKTYFNPRARVGRDDPPADSLQHPHYFNPRARVGRDPEGVRRGVGAKISIHAPAWGATKENA